MKILISNEASWLCPLTKSELSGLLFAMCTPYLEEDAPPLVLHVVRDAQISAINEAHMACVGPTNILSFPSEESTIRYTNIVAEQYITTPQQTTELKHPHILVLSVDTLQRECLLYGQDSLEHTIRLLAHGLGHIMGYDHSEEMFALCEEMEMEGKAFALEQGWL